MNNHEVDKLMNTSGLGDHFDFLGIDVTDFSVAEEAIEEHMQNSQRCCHRNSLNFNDDKSEIFPTSRFGHAPSSWCY